MVWEAERVRKRKAGRDDIVRSVGSREGNTSLLQEVSDVGMITGVAGRRWPGTQCGASLPAACIEKDHVAGRYLNVLQFFQRLEVFSMDGRSRLKPALRRGLSRSEEPSCRERG